MSIPDLYVRRATIADVGPLSRICLFTADAGSSARSLHTLGELPGLVYALPYVHMPYTAGFVLACRRASADYSSSNGSEEVVGYILLATDTRAFEEAAEKQWYPPLRTVYPLSLLDTPVSTSDEEGDQIETHSLAKPLTSADKHYIQLLHKPDSALPECVAFSPAHMHIDILPSYQRLGWGKRLISHAVQYLRDEAGLKGVWLGMDPRNKDAARFYQHLGFEYIEGAPETCVGLNFDNWSD